MSPFPEMRREYAGGNDRILRGATAVLLIHAPKESRFGAEDANLAYQNASLMAEALGVSQIYMGFVLTAVRQDRKRGSARCWDSAAAVSVPSWRSGCRSSATRIISTARLPLWSGDRRAGLPGAVPGIFQLLFRVFCGSRHLSAPPGCRRDTRRSGLCCAGAASPLRLGVSCPKGPTPPGSSCFSERSAR